MRLIAGKYGMLINVNLTEANAVDIITCIRIYAYPQECIS